MELGVSRELRQRVNWQRPTITNARDIRAKAAHTVETGLSKLQCQILSLWVVIALEHLQ